MGWKIFKTKSRWLKLNDIILSIDDCNLDLKSLGSTDNIHYGPTLTSKLVLIIYYPDEVASKFIRYIKVLRDNKIILIDINQNRNGGDLND